MALFRKIIATPSVYRVNTPKGRQIKAITKEYLQSICKTANEMYKAGLRIPGPYAHKDKNGVHPGPVVEQEGKEVDAETLKDKVWSSDFNAGFWEKFEMTDDGLVGYFNAPGEPDKEDTPAGKVGKVVKDTSVFVTPEFTDGLGRTWKNALRHVALVTNPIEPAQSNFDLVNNSPEHALAMSFSMADEVGGDVGALDTSATVPGVANIPELVRLLKDRLELELPQDTDVSNFFDRLLTVLTSIPNNAGEDEDTTKKPEGSDVVSSPVLMSDEIKTGDEKTVEINKALENKAGNLLNTLLTEFRKNLKTRINTLIRSGKVGKKYADSTLFPAVESFAMSLEDLDDEGNFPKTPIEMSLDILEDNVGLLEDKETNETDGDVEPQPEDMEDAPKMTDEEADELIARVI